MSHSSAMASSTSTFSSTEPISWFGAKGAFLVLLGFILAREFLYVSLDFSLGFLAGFWEGIVGPVSDAFWIELNHWTAPFLSIVSVVGGAGTGLWIIFKQSKGQSPFQWLFKSIWEPNHGSYFTWPFL